MEATNQNDGVVHPWGSVPFNVHIEKMPDKNSNGSRRHDRFKVEYLAHRDRAT